jgi:hypothetical protein
MAQRKFKLNKLREHIAGIQALLDESDANMQAAAQDESDAPAGMDGGPRGERTLSMSEAFPGFKSWP